MSICQPVHILDLYYFEDIHSGTKIILFLGHFVIQKLKKNNYKILQQFSRDNLPVGRSNIEETSEYYVLETCLSNMTFRSHHGSYIRS